MKTCPYCAEEIKDAAIRCRWCLTWLVEEIPAGAETMPVMATEEAEESAAVLQATIVQPVPVEAAVEEPAEPEPVTAPMEPMVVPVGAAPEQVAPVEEPAAQAAPAADAKVEFTHTGTRYLLGYGADYFGIWDRNAPQVAIERFPRNDPGWASAWQRYSAIETNWMDLRTGQKSS